MGRQPFKKPGHFATIVFHDALVSRKVKTSGYPQSAMIFLIKFWLPFHLATNPLVLWNHAEFGLACPGPGSAGCSSLVNVRVVLVMIGMSVSLYSSAAFDQSLSALVEALSLMRLWMNALEMSGRFGRGSRRASARKCLLMLDSWGLGSGGRDGFDGVVDCGRVSAFVGVG